VQAISGSRNKEVSLELLELLNVYTAKCPPLAAHPRERAQVQEVLQLMVLAALALVDALLDRQTSSAWPTSLTTLLSSKNSGGSDSGAAAHVSPPAAAAPPAWSEAAASSDLKLDGAEESKGGGPGKSAQESAAAARERLAKVHEKRLVCVRALRALSAHLAVVMERVCKDGEDGPGAGGGTVMGGASVGAQGLTTKVVDSLKHLIRATPRLATAAHTTSASNTTPPHHAPAAQAPLASSVSTISSGVPEIASTREGASVTATASAQGDTAAGRGGGGAVWIEQANEAVAVLASLNRPMFIKSWRKEVLEVFNDATFFQMGIACNRSWALLVDVAMSQETGAFSELAAAGTPASSSNVLSGIGLGSGTLEAKYRSHADQLRRLAYVLLAGETDQYANMLPQILEKLVDALRLPCASGFSRLLLLVHEQAFLCMRVVLLRNSARNLVSLWPIIMSEGTHSQKSFLHVVMPYVYQDADFSECALK